MPSTLKVGDAVMGRFYGEWHPARIRNILSSEIEVVWDSEYSCSCLHLSDVKHRSEVEALQSKATLQDFNEEELGIIPCPSQTSTQASEQSSGLSSPEQHEESIPPPPPPLTLDTNAGRECSEPGKE